MATITSLLAVLLTVVVANAQGTPTWSTQSTQFTVPASANEGMLLLPNVLDPQAVDAQTVCPGYKASDVKDTELGFTATLRLAAEPCNLYGTDIEVLSLAVECQSADRISVNIQPAYIVDSNASHYILPDHLVTRPTADPDAKMSCKSNDLELTWSNDPSFSFTIMRKSTGDAVFDTRGKVLVYENQFIEFVTSLPENYNLYGLGERIHELRLGNNFTATMYSADSGDPVDYNIYGQHPFYLDTRYYSDDGHNKKLLQTAPEDDAVKYDTYSHGVYLRNAHGQEVLLRASNLTWRTLGGSINLYFYSGPSQPEVTKQYQLSTTGLPAMQQYFSFGYHQCRWGYTSWTQLQEVVDNFRRFDIPLETVWLDIDYMNQYRDFTNDENAFPLVEGQEFLKKLHDGHQHWVPIVDAAIYIPNPENENDAYNTYSRGHENQLFLLNPDGSEYVGSVWPGYTVFPDWLAPNAVDWWVKEVADWYKELQFDGLWIDMNEPSSFCVGSCGSGNMTLNPVHPSFQLPGEPRNVDYDFPEGFEITNATEAASASAASSSQAATTSSTSNTTSTSYLRTTPIPGVRDINYPPYVINHVNGDLAVHGVSPNATHNDGVHEYDVHGIYGHQILNATYQALLKVLPGKRPFIIGRSTFAGSGKWAGHWGGDNYSKFYYMYASIPQALTFSLFGIPMFGVDTCGFSGNADLELCSRWMQLSAFFPFYRNHNILSAAPQEPYVWAAVAEASRVAMKIRYALLPHLYTLFHKAHTTGSTVMRALSWEFPGYPALAIADRQFLLGPAILITPVLEAGAKEVMGVFPGTGDGEVWYDWYNQTAISVAPGANVSIAAPLGHIPVYVRGGHVLPLQEPGYTTYECRRNPWALLVALGSDGFANGELYIDDGESLEPESSLMVTFDARGSRLQVRSHGQFVDGNPLANVTIMGVSQAPREVKRNGKALDKLWEFDSRGHILKVTGLQELTKGGAWSDDWELVWS
ncbi:family 31 glycosyl hydrolase [Eremomyces bilateralis CBS 781.70]|uniref:alpha-glucosidase n=1 Tax=Eremomyces bilateralis CBS 781.70 TaxID=1392243 RepID=A0A6G1FYF0_9PEZI|nr:family 31 glycosyl hydrolase [Eremomyces bilateralis CBS 781.70]KAF1810721.1 family 31 glycosyl hydrolase [Eremomyces bilateralis CBS 781.70]